MTNLTGNFISAYHIASGFRMPDIDENHCPLCGDDMIDYVETDYSKDSVFMRYTCAECGSEFEFHYELTGTFIVNDKHNKED